MGGGRASQEEKSGGKVKGRDKKGSPPFHLRPHERSEYNACRPELPNKDIRNHEQKFKGTVATYDLE